jgi:hypothetical protein
MLKGLKVKKVYVVMIGFSNEKKTQSENSAINMTEVMSLKL